MPSPADFWKPFEKEISSFKEVLDLIHDVFDSWSSSGSVFAWRGVGDASWALHSSLYRRLLWTKGGSSAPDEGELQLEETAILKALHRWGLHASTHGRLSALGQLAVLQHYGAPTRLLDVTFNPLIGLWFAVEQQWDNGEPKNDDKDGRLFAIDVANRLINDDDTRRAWEENTQPPWANFDNLDGNRDWTTVVRAWRPARLDHRIAAQNGGFLLGGVPASSGPGGAPVQWLKDPAKPGEFWLIDDVRRSLAVPLRIHKLNPSAGRDPNNPTYTIRIKSSAKAEIRKCLEDLYDYRHATIYPDYPGFALHGHPRLKSRP